MDTKAIENVISLAIARNPGLKENYTAAKQLVSLKSRLAEAESIILSGIVVTDSDSAKRIRAFLQGEKEGE
jgi:hypothetical protein